MAPGVVDARRCLAWLVQAEGVFPVEHRVALGDRLYGCDDCQEVCPPSRPGRDGLDPAGSPAPASGSPAPAPGSAQGSPAPAGRSDGPGDWADVVALLDADDDALLARFGRWYIPRRQPRYLRRNALIVLGNTGSPDHPQVRRVLGQALADPDPLLRAHAVWAARRLGLGQLLAPLADDSDELVRAELDRPERDLAAAAAHPGPPSSGA